MNDSDTTLNELKALVLDMCRYKGWGVDGEQDPQHVAMAMTVEMSELLEPFQWLDKPAVEALKRGEDDKRVALIAEELADVMMYGLQLAHTLDIDITTQLLRKIAIVKRRPKRADEPAR